MTTFSKPETNPEASKPNGRRKISPPIPLERPEKKELEIGDYHKYELRNDPDDPESPKYSVSVPYFSTGTCEEWLQFRRNLDRVLEGQGITTGPQSFVVARRLLTGAALTTFENKARGLNETVANFTAALDAVAKDIFPARAVLVQKRFLRRFARKPQSMKMREYVARIVEINEYLPQFPPVRPGEDVETLPDDEIADLLEFGCPNSWQKHMLMQNFDPLLHSVNELVEFCERMEQVEAVDTGSRSSKPAAKNESKKKSAKRKRDSKETKDCLLHGDDCGHTTHECRTLKYQAKAMKGRYNAQTAEGKKQLKNKEELHSLIADAVEKSLAEKKKAKKQKREETNAELNHFESLSISSESDSDSSDE